MRNGAPVDEDVLARMSDVIRHRGPDDSGSYIAGSVGLAFRRLAILDLSPAGHQPMKSPDGHAVVVFNGEIYNFLELRNELIALGHAFVSTGDTEVLLHAYLEWGSDCVRRFNGMWAFVIYDARRDVVFGSRDRFGIKPLYRHIGDDAVLLASEIKAIRISGLYVSVPNWSRAARFLLDGQIDETCDTFYAGIEQVPPGSAFEIDRTGRIKQWQFWSLDAARIGTIADPAAALAELFEDAVRLHTRSDVPVGVHLSGGLDSTSIICALARQRRAANATGPLMAFSYIASDFDESRFIDETIRQTGATLVRLETDATRLWQLLEEVLWYQDEPVYSMMPLVAYELMRLTAGNGVKVILNGQGADETIAGYPNYFSDYWCSLIGEGRAREAWREIGEHVAVQGGSRRRIFRRQIQRITRARLRSAAPYRALSGWRRRQRALNHPWFARALAEQLPEEEPRRATIGLDGALRDSIYVTPLPRILRIEDRNSMAHSIESRLPFLDYRLVSLMFSLDVTWRMRGPWNKFVLREAMRGRIPEALRNRVDKMGFPVPSGQWVNALYEPIRDLLASRSARERGIYNIDAIVRDLDRHRRGDVHVADQLFDVAQFETWSAL